MADFSITMGLVAGENPDCIVKLAMCCGQSSFTKVLRHELTDDGMLVPAAPLAFWFAQNWWRLRWEASQALLPDDRSYEWSMAHEMNSIGAGHVWPRLTIWSDGNRIRFQSRADAPGIVSPVRLLESALTFTSAKQFEIEIDKMFDGASQILSMEDRTEFAKLITSLSEERADDSIAQWRRLEAISGFDPDEAPEAMIDRLCVLESVYGAGGIEEAVSATPGADAAAVLDYALEMVNTAPQAEFAEIITAAGYPSVRDGDVNPWEQAEASAKRVRHAAGFDETSPLLNKRLSELCHIENEVIATSTSHRSQVPYALCASDNHSRTRVLLTARYSHDKRFQLARALGDEMWRDRTGIGPITNSYTSRQQFQRAFAAALLCPEDGLQEFFDGSNFDDEGISEAARHFHVNEKTVRTVLVNKGRLSRNRLSPWQYENTGDVAGDLIVAA